MFITGLTVKVREKKTESDKTNDVYKTTVCVGYETY